MDDPDTEIARLKKINAALMGYVERSTDQQGNAYSLFQTAISLEGQVKRRTEELTALLMSLENTNRELEIAKTAAENANLSKTRFLAAASHDLLQPLNAAHLLMSSLSDLQRSTESQALAEQVERSLDTIDELLRSLLDISRLDAGVVEPNIKDVGLNDLFLSLESDFKPIAQQRNIRLRFRPTSRYVKSDRTLLRRVMQNIISNAIRYTASGGVLVGSRLKNGVVRIEVLDSGIGIAKEQHSAIFEEFHRGTTPNDPDDDFSAGLGLGLAIVSRMMHTLGHELNFYSALGKGSCFQVSLPASTSQYTKRLGTTKLKEPPQWLGIAGSRVLLIENDLAVKQAMQSLLGKWQCDTRAAASTGEALALLTELSWQPTVIIADQHLNHGDLGSTTILAIRDMFDHSLPAIIITADPSEKLTDISAQESIELMYKPVKPAELRALLAHVLS